MCEETGPPTLKDDAWVTHHWASLGYPRVKLAPQFDGQMNLLSINSVLEQEAVDREMQQSLDDEAQQFRTDRPE